MEVSELRAALSATGMKKGDTVMIHGGAMFASQLTSIPADERLTFLFNEILNYLGKDGTLVVPTFTYSFTKSEVYDVQNTPSTLGKFSEHFRRLFPNHRSRQPIFSVVAVGHNQDLFKSSSIDDCFGKGSIFDLLYLLDAKLMCLACSYNVITYIHYVEQSVGVKYRYYKDFTGVILDNGVSKEISTRYLVGDLSLRYSFDLDRLRDYLEDRSEIKYVPFGKMNSCTLTARDAFSGAKTLLGKNEYSLIQEGLKVEINK